MFDEVINELKKLPDLYKKLEANLEEIIPILESAENLAKKYMDNEPLNIAMEIYHKVGRGMPYSDAVLLVSKEEDIPIDYAIYCYNWRFRRTRAYQQYMYHLVRKMLYEADYPAKSVHKVIEKLGLTACCPRDIPLEEVCDSVETLELTWEKMMKEKTEKPNRWRGITHKKADK